MLYVNADDWGWNKKATDSILACYKNNSVNSASAMVFMKDSQRSAELALENDIDIGLHLNFTAVLTGENVTDKLCDSHNRLVNFFTGSKYNRILYNPFLYSKLEYCFKKQWSEFQRLYGRPPSRLDGHHHIHLCSNLLFSNVLPQGIKVRPNFFFKPGQKSFINRFYRKTVDSFLKKKFDCVDYLYKLPQNVNETWLYSIVEQAKQKDIELEVHPENQVDFELLMNPKFQAIISSANI